MPAWLVASIEETTGAPIGARNARHTRHTCGATVLEGLDADVLAFLVTVDPGPLTVATELAAVLTGRRTYRAWPTPTQAGLRIQLTRRDRFDMRRPPGTLDLLKRPLTALAEHRCGFVLGDPVQALTEPPEPSCDHAPPY